MSLGKIIAFRPLGRNLLDAMIEFLLGLQFFTILQVRRKMILLSTKKFEFLVIDIINGKKLTSQSGEMDPGPDFWILFVGF